MVFALYFSLALYAETPLPVEVKDYSKKLSRFRNSLNQKRGDSSLEGVFQSGFLASNEALKNLSQLDPSDLNRLGLNLEGFLIQRSPETYIVPDPKFFLELAASRGSDGDKAFFNLLDGLRAEPHRPAYLQITEKKGTCTSWTRALETKKNISEFKTQYPQPYAFFLEQEDQALLTALKSKCICEDSDAATLRAKELSELFKRTIAPDKEAKFSCGS